MDKDIKTTLLDDDEFVRLIEAEGAAESEAVSLAQQRVWQRLQESKAKVRKKSPTPWIAAAVLLLGLGGGVMVLQSPTDDTFKSGGSGEAAGQALSLVLQASTVEIRLQEAGHLGYAAVIQDGKPFSVLWQGNVQDWKQPLSVPKSDSGRICLWEAATAEELRRNLDVMKELGEIPADLLCAQYP